MYALKIVNREGSLTGISENPSEYSTSLEESNEQLEDQITTLAGQINAANYRFLKLIAEFDRRQVWAGYGIRSCAHWLNWKCGIAMTAAREKVRTARALEGLPKINAAFQKGELSFSKVRAMTRVATVENESHLLNIAEYGTAQHMEILVKSYRKVIRADTSETELSKQELDAQERQQDNRSVMCYQDDDGMWIINAKLPAEEGGLIAKALTELGNSIAKAQTLQTEKDENTHHNSAKSVSAEIFSLDTQPEKLTFPQRRADALVAITEHFLALSKSEASRSEPKLSLSALKASERCQLVLHVRAGSLNHTKPEDALVNAHLDGRWLMPNAARRMTCDAGLLVVEEDDAGNVLNIGRRSRIIPPAMSRALAIRDGGCQFPGCCETRYVEGHHIKHWAEGGETKLDNLVTLCRHHHQELHKGRFFLSLKPVSINDNASPQRFAERLCFSKVERYFDAPFNRASNIRNINNDEESLIPANPATFTCACCDSSNQHKNVADELAKIIPNAVFNSINANTAVTKWAGERLDVGMAIDGLLSAKRRE